MMMTEFEKSPDDNQPPRGGRGRQPRCWARRESGVSRGTGGGITFGRSPNDNQPRLGESAAAPGEGESTKTQGVGGGVGRGARGGSALTLVASFFLSFSSQLQGCKAVRDVVE